MRYEIKKKADLKNLKNLVRCLTTNFSCEITYSKLAKILNIGHVSTASNWITYLEDSFLISTLERFSFKLKQQFIAPKKIYCIDNGIIHATGFRFSEDAGRFM